MKMESAPVATPIPTRKPISSMVTKVSSLCTQLKTPLQSAETGAGSSLPTFFPSSVMEVSSEKVNVEPGLALEISVIAG